MTLPPHPATGLLVVLMLASFAAPITRGEIHAIRASVRASAPRRDSFKMGTSKNPQGREITMNSVTLLCDGKPWLPVMGEFHYSRYPASEWRDELLKMKAGGITVVATYVFWIHHEEVKGQWDWAGQKSLREFVKICADVGSPEVVRLGPWCHGEVGNGGLPEWPLPMGRRPRLPA